MKAQKLIVALASMALLASCGGQSASASASGLSVSQSASGLSVKKTMAFLENGQFYASIPGDVTALVGGNRPKILVNGIDIQGDLKYSLNGKFTLEAQGEFEKDLYITIAASDAEDHMVVKVYGAIEKEHINDAFPMITSTIGVPNKLYIAFSTTKASWVKGLDAEMDQAIASVWGEN